VFAEEAVEEEAMTATTPAMVAVGFAQVKEVATLAAETVAVAAAAAVVVVAAGDLEVVGLEARKEAVVVDLVEAVEVAMDSAERVAVVVGRGCHHHRSC